MMVWLIALSWLFLIKAIPGDTIVFIPFNYSIPYIEGDSTNVWYQIKTLGSTINRHIYVALYDTDGLFTSLYNSSLEALGDSIKGCIGLDYLDDVTIMTNYFIANYPSLKGMLMAGAWASSEEMVAYCDDLINTKHLDLCFLPIDLSIYNPSQTYVSFWTQSSSYADASAAFNDASIEAGIWAKTYIVLELTLADFENIKSIIPSSLAYIYSYDESSVISTYLDNLLRYIKTNYTCYPLCMDCNEANNINSCVGSCQKGFDLSGTTCVCTNANKEIIGTGDSATCNCTGDLVNINGVCSACQGQTKPNNDDNGCNCWDQSEPLGNLHTMCPPCPGQTKLNDNHDGCNCWDQSVPTGNNHNVCPPCPGQSKLNDNHDGCDCWDQSEPTGAVSDTCPPCPGETKLNDAKYCGCWDGSAPTGANLDVCPQCPGDTFLNSDNSDCVCPYNYIKEANNTCTCEFLFGATLISEEVCGCPDTSVLSDDKTSCICPLNGELNFTTMKCETTISGSLPDGKFYFLLLIIALEII